MANLNDHGQRFRQGLPSSNPFSSLGTGWCSRCRMEVGTDTQAAYHDSTYAWKQTCERCGAVLSRGVYANVPLFSNIPLPPAALDWTLTPGRDRR